MVGMLLRMMLFFFWLLILLYLFHERTESINLGFHDAELLLKCFIGSRSE